MASEHEALRRIEVGDLHQAYDGLVNSKHSGRLRELHARSTAEYPDMERFVTDIEAEAARADPDLTREEQVRLQERAHGMRMAFWTLMGAIDLRESVEYLRFELDRGLPSHPGGSVKDSGDR